MLLQPCCPTPRARREAELPRKHARQVTLVRETRHSRRVVSEALADLLEVRGWRIAPPRRAMPRHQAYTTCDQRFLECQGIHRSRVRLAIVPALETRKQTL